MLDQRKIVGRGKTGSAIEFRDECWKTFRISGSAKRAIEEQEELLDTMRYSNLVMSIWTDREGFQRYHAANDDDIIEVYGISIGDKSYINLDEINAAERKGIIELLIFCSVGYIIFLSIHFYRLLNSERLRLT